MQKRKRQLALCLIFAILLSILPFSGNSDVVWAGDKVLTLAQAQRLAVAKSSGYKKVLNKIDMQEIKYAAAVKSIQMKKKNMSTFRWTPLLNFKFPENPSLVDEYEWQYKPLQISCVINQLKHQLNDEILASKEEISLLYVDAYICQEKIGFAQKQLTGYETTLEKNKLRLATGEASQADIDKIEQKIEKLKVELALQQRTYETKKQKISKLIGLNVTSGYRFAEPYIKAEIPRSALDGLVEHTLENDQTYYETKLNTQLILSSLNMTESLMKNQYGYKLNRIQSFVTQARNGGEVDSASFKSAYKEMLADVDSPWTGKKRILFVKINKEWFKGAKDGSRYVEDNPYQLYEEALEYAEAVKEQISVKEELETSVRDNFETLVTMRNSYDAAQISTETLEEEVEKALVQNRLGELPYEELADLQGEYEEQQLNTLGLLAEYTKQLYAYDRLTCGGISSYLEKEDISMQTSYGGNSYIKEEMEGKVYYYIDYKIENQMFVFGISVPENYSLEMTHYELRVNDTTIGSKMEIGQELMHLALDLDKVETSKVYLYNEDELIAVCEFDSTVNQSTLEITGGYVTEEQSAARTVAYYSYKMNENLGTVELSFVRENTEPISYYKLLDKQGRAMTGDELLEISESFSYLSLLTGDLSELSVEFYNASKELLYKGDFIEKTGTIEVIAN